MIIRNSAKCLGCGDEIESTHRHDFKWCSCRKIFVDGGKDYARRGGDPRYFADTSIALEEVASKDKPEEKEKILIWDVETSKLEATTYSLRNRYIHHSNIKKDWYIFCGSWKFLGQDKIHSVSLLSDVARFRNDHTDDYKVCKQLREALLEANVIVHHNGDKFDIKKLNTRLIYHRLPPLPVKLTAVDTLKEARHTFAFSSNSLDYLGRYLGVGGKLKTSEDMFDRAKEGDVSALNEMVSYNKQDVKLLEDVYKIMRPYIRHPNTAAIAANDSSLCCTDCQSTNLQYRGVSVTKLGTKRRFQCQDCGKWGHNPEYESKTLLRAA